MLYPRNRSSHKTAAKALDNINDERNTNEWLKLQCRDHAWRPPPLYDAQMAARVVGSWQLGS